MKFYWNTATVIHVCNTCGYNSRVKELQPKLFLLDENFLYQNLYFPKIFAISPFDYLILTNYIRTLLLEIKNNSLKNF